MDNILPAYLVLAVGRWLVEGFPIPIRCLESPVGVGGCLAYYHFVAEVNLA